MRYLILILALVTSVAQARDIIDNVLKIGTGVVADNYVEVDQGLGANNPKLLWESTLNQWQQCDETGLCVEIGAGGGGGLPTLSKGSLLTSDGTQNGEFTACNDGEILEYDSAQTAGLTCGAKPVAPVVPTPVLYTGTASGSVTPPSGTINAYASANLVSQVTGVTVAAGEVVMLNSQHSGAARAFLRGRCIIYVGRNGSEIADYEWESSSTGLGNPPAFTWTESVAGTHTYDIRVSEDGSSTGCFVSNIRLNATVIK